MDIRPGDIIYGKDESEKFEVIDFINRGAFGFVYKIRKSGTSEFYALKTIPTSFLDGKNLKALINEGKLAPTIKHENVVDVIFFHDGLQYKDLPPYIIMEYLPEGTLQNLLDAQRKTKTLFDNQQLTEIFLQLAHGMKAINYKLIHRDLKPDNILIAKGKLKISDFGLSKVVGAATRTSSFKGIQHIHYMAPEAWRLEANTIQMDMYSLGIVYYELATLTHPYKVDEKGDVVEAWKDAHFFQKADNPNSKNAALSPHLSQLIMKMIAKKPEDRYKNWDEIINRIQAAQPQPEEPKLDVAKLVSKALQTQEKEEKDRLEAEKKEKARQEIQKLVQYQAEELTSALQEIVDTFNKSYDGPKIKIMDNSSRHDPTKMLSAVFPGKGQVNLVIQPVYQSLKFEDTKTIRAWGYFKNSNGKGFNLMLVLENPEDTYGKWVTLHNTHNPIARPRDKRPDPFPFEPFDEFTKEIRHVHSVHIYEMRIDNFDKKMLILLFEDIL